MKRYRRRQCPEFLLFGLAAGLLAVGAASCHDSPTEPLAHSLAGKWDGSLTRSPCLGDWSRVEMSLEQSAESVTGTIQTQDGQQFPISGAIANGAGLLHVALPPNAEACSSVEFEVKSVGPATFSSEAQGRCCGTILEDVEFVRSGQ